MDKVKMQKKSLSRVIQLKNFKKGQFVCCSVTTQANNGINIINVRLFEDKNNVYREVTISYLDTPQVSVNQGFIIEGDNLNLEIAVDDKPLEKAYIYESVIKSDEGYELGNIFTLSGESMSIEPAGLDYNDVCVHLVAWNVKE